jgi:hypothetical protein
MERVENHDGAEEVLELVIEGYDSHAGNNIVLRERIKAMEFADRMDMVKRLMSSMNLALVRHEASAASGV